MAKHFFIIATALVLCKCLLAEAQYDAAAYRDRIIPDDTNDDAVGLTAQQLAERSGFRHETYNVTADDGYITQIIRIINPLVRRLRPIPILIHHGALIDQAFYLAASSIQHHPEPYPRTAEDGPITSSNRSLGFFLANNGYDVFLVGTRGSNEGNQGHFVNATGGFAVFNGDNSRKKMSPSETAYEYARTPYYWQYSYDDVAQHEIKNVVDKVRNITGQREFSLFSYSLSTPTTLVFFNLYPEYARDCRLYTQMAPAITAVPITATTSLYFGGICNLEPSRGNGVTATFVGGPLLNQTYLALTEPYTLRYTALKLLFNELFGQSPQYQTNLEKNLVSRVNQPVSFKTIQQYCQQIISQQFRKFDYGLANQQVYGQPTPPLHNATIEVQNYLIISGTVDALSSPQTIQNVKNLVKTPKPAMEIVAPLYNHADLGAGVENDKYVNQPFLGVLNQYAGDSA